MNQETYTIAGLTFALIHHSEDDIQQLNEANNKGRHLAGTYTFDIHSPHNPAGEYHIHLRDKGKEILSMNKTSGTAHDGYHGIRIPNKAFKALKAKLPDWNWPDNQILESTEFTYFLNRNSDKDLRPVKVFQHRNFDLEMVEPFTGFFHQFGEDPFLTGGGGGWKERTVAIIETEDGYIRKVPVDAFKFV